MDNIFKVGDKIKLKNNSINVRIYTIEKILQENNSFLRYETHRDDIIWDKWSIWNNNFSNGNEEITNFELVERKILKLKDFLNEE
jgi:hypothetical protein